MPRPRTLPDISILLRQRDVEGLTLAQIGARYGVSKAAVSGALKKAGNATGGNAAMSYDTVIPWRIVRGHMALDAAKRLRAHLRAHNNLDVSPEMRLRLTNWYARLRRDGTVLDYRPAGSTPWIYVRREPSDGDLLIRWPAGQSMSEQQRMSLSFPAGA